MSFQVFGGFRPEIFFYKLFFGDLAEGEEAVATGGTLLAAHDAVLDGLFDHLQGQTQVNRSIFAAFRLILHPHKENYHCFI